MTTPWEIASLPPSRLAHAPAPASSALRPDQSVSAEEGRLRSAARAFEAAFLAEMLRHAGLGRMPAGFNGGAGEAAFAGTLVEEYARAIARNGGVGLAEQIYRALAERAQP